MADYKNDIDKYLSGEMTPAEMHALEKKALHDPFLADALEGAQQLPQEDFAADLKDLEQAMQSRLTQRSSGWWIGRIAAGLLLLAVSTYLVVLMPTDRSEKASEQLALNKEEQSPATPSPAPAPPADSMKEQGDHDENAHLSISKRAGEPVESRRTKDQSIARAPEEKPKAELEAAEEKQPVVAADTPNEIVQAERQLAQANPEAAPPPSISGEADKKRDATNDDEFKEEVSKSASGARAKALSSSSYAVNRKIIKGKVTFSEDGMGLPGVNVLIKGSNEGTVTDGQGNYEILAEEAQPTLLFSFIGFANKEAIAKSEQLDVQLDADVSELSEVVVVGYGADGSVSSPAPSVMELATPEGGRKAFKQYLEKNLQYPEQALKNEVEGKVTVQFSIGMTGQLTDFRVIRGIGYGCDEEVIRLIKAGPKWQPTKKNEEPIKDRVRVRMRFALPKK